LRLFDDRFISVFERRFYRSDDRNAKAQVGFWQPPRSAAGTKRNCRSAHDISGAERRPAVTINPTAAVEQGRVETCLPPRNGRLLAGMACGEDLADQG
jgi:hypothetical protein